MRQGAQERRSSDGLWSRWSVALLVFAIWVAVSTLFALVLSAQEDIHFVWSFQTSALQCLILLVLVAPLWLLLRASRLWPWWLRALVHVALLVTVVPLWLTVYGWALELTAGRAVVDLYLESSGLWRYLQSALLYGVAVGGMVVVQTTSRLRREQRRAQALRLSMREAELRALRAQLRPHFLFNALNSIYALIPREPERAGRMVALLSDLLRETLERTDQETVPFERELDLVERYLAIEEIRFADRLQFAVEVEDRAKRATVPPFLLQPLVENSLHHGLANSPEGGKIEITATVEVHTKETHITVSDNGLGLGEGRLQEGNGLRITRTRLAAQFGEDSYSLDVTNRDGGGCRVDLVLPFVEFGDDAS